MTGLDHQLCGALRGEEHAAHVDVVDEVEVIGVKVEETTEPCIGMRGNASRRDADVDPTDLRTAA